MIIPSVLIPSFLRCWSMLELIHGGVRFLSVCEAMKGRIGNRNLTSKKSIRAEEMRMWFASLIARPVAKERKKKNGQKRLLGHVF